MKNQKWKFIDFNQSIFYFQKAENFSCIRKSSTFAIIKKIKFIGQYDYDLKRRISCSHDAVAGDLLYHTYCMENKLREINKLDAESLPENLSFVRLCYELKVAASKSQVGFILIPKIFLSDKIENVSSILKVH